MNPEEFLIKLSKHPIGLQEATCLILIGVGYDTNKALIGKTGDASTLIYSRIQILRRKKYINSVYSKTGVLNHKLAPKGERLLKDVMPAFYDR